MVELDRNKNNVFYIIIFVIIILLLILIGLIAWSLFSVSAENNQSELECVTNLDCAGTDICDNGICIDECRIAADCQNGWECTGGTCTPGCLINIDCPDSWTCQGGACTPQCTSDANCATSQTCNLGVCQAIVMGCNLIGIPTGLNGSSTGPDELTLSWNKSTNATGYVVYLGTTSGFLPGDAIQSQIKIEPDRIATFTSLAPGTYYVRVSATSVSCPGTDLSNELVIIIP